MKIVIDDKIPYTEAPLAQLSDALRARGTCLDAVRLPGNAIGPADVRDAEVLIVRTRTRCDASLLRGSRVQLVVTATIGYDHLDTTWLDAADIRWTNCPGCNATSVAQYVAACLVLLQPRLSRPLADTTLGIVGVGHVGRAVAAAALSMGVGRLLLNDPPRQQAEGLACSVEENVQWTSLDELLARSNVVTFHTPLTRDGHHPTHHLLGTHNIHLLQPDAAIINAARGGVIDESALTAELRHGHLRPLIIDTWEDEPAINPTLLAHTFLATPHIAGYSADGKANATRMSMEAMARHLGIDVSFDVQPPAQTAPYGSVTCSCEPPEPPLTPRQAELLWHYDPRHDSARLKADPSGFERQRGHYPLRREK